MRAILVLSVLFFMSASNAQSLDLKKSNESKTHYCYIYSMDINVAKSCDALIVKNSLASEGFAIINDRISNNEISQSIVYNSAIAMRKDTFQKFSYRKSGNQITYNYSNGCSVTYKTTESNGILNEVFLSTAGSCPGSLINALKLSSASKSFIVKAD